jgi:4-hydroxybenzoate polyprenyltransferase
VSITDLLPGVGSKAAWPKEMALQSDVADSSAIDGSAPIPAWRTWISALRLHQWVKNVLVFVPLLLARDFTLRNCLEVGTGFLIFGIVASGTYLVNDLRDLESDRAHPDKRGRALASGRIAVSTALAVAAATIVGGVVASFLLNAKFGFAVLAYVAITGAYSFKFKNEPMFDVFIIGVLFVLRVIAGLVLVHDPISLWLSGFTFTFFMSLAMAKRHSELVIFRRSRAGTPMGRGYVASDIGLTRAFGVGSALLAFLIMLLYFQFRAMATGLYDTVELLYVVPVAVFAWNLRIWLLASRGLLRHDPIMFALRDRVSLGYAAFIFVIWAIATK